MAKIQPVSMAQVERSIVVARGHRVMLDEDLAHLYNVPVKRLNEQVRRNRNRFPEDFMFQLTGEELANLRSQFATSSLWGGRRYAHYAFTEQGVAMLSSVLRSERAVQVNIAIMRTFVRLRQLLLRDADLARKLAALERRYDSRFAIVFDAIRRLTTPSTKPTARIGFTRRDL